MNGDQGIFSPYMDIMQSTGSLPALNGTTPDVMVMQGMPSSTDWPFELEGGKVVNNWLYFGRRLLECDDMAVTVPKTGDSYIWAVVSHPEQDGEAELSVLCTASKETAKNTLAVTYRLLYVMKDGAVVTDARCMPWVVAMA